MASTVRDIVTRGFGFSPPDNVPGFIVTRGYGLLTLPAGGDDDFPVPLGGARDPFPGARQARRQRQEQERLAAQRAMTLEMEDEELLILN